MIQDTEIFSAKLENWSCLWAIPRCCCPRSSSWLTQWSVGTWPRQRRRASRLLERCIVWIQSLGDRTVHTVQFYKWFLSSGKAYYCSVYWQQNKSLGKWSEPAWSKAHLTRGYLGSRDRLRVLGRWNTTEYRGLRSFLKLPFLTAFSAFWALALLASKCREERIRPEVAMNWIWL